MIHKFNLQQIAVIVLLFVGAKSFGQGIKAEKSFNNTHNQTPEQILVDGTSTFLLINEHSWNTFSILPVLYKLDEDGAILFRVVVTHESGEVFRALRMVAGEDGGVYIAGTAMEQCDVPEPTPFIKKYNAVCDLQWTRSIVPDEDYEWFLSGLSLVQDIDLSQKLVFSISVAEEWHDTSRVYMMSTDGMPLDSIPVYNNQFEYFEILEADQFVASKNDSLFTFNLDGDLIRFREFNENIGQLAVKGDTLFVLTKDSLSYLNNDFVTLNGTDVGENFRNFRLYDDGLYVQGTNLTEQQIYTLDYGLELTSTSVIPFELSENHISHFSKEQYAVATPFELTDHQSVRYLNFSLLTLASVTPGRSDAGIINLKVLNTVFSGDDMYVNLYTEVLVKNYGTNEITSCRINHYVWQGIACGESYFSVEYTGLNIAPGDSAWIELGWTGSRLAVDPFGGDPAFNYCFYTSHVNELCDLNVPNDQYCRDLYGQLDLKSNKKLAEITVFPNPFKSTITVKNLPHEYAIFTLYDLVGQVVITGSTDEINASQLPAGTYLLELSGTDMPLLNQLIIKE